MAKHTPGPWHIHKLEHGGYCDYNIGDSNCTLLAVVDRNEANAKLIAAAPDLLEACKALMKHCEGINKYPMSYGFIQEAIAKATEGVNDAKDTG